jgi:quercetin dioxygenase-like cupin family protein
MSAIPDIRGVSWHFEAVFMRGLRIFAFMAAFLSAAWSTAGAQAARGPAPRVTELAGSRDAPGLFTQRLILPANYCGPVHVHDQDLHGLVLRGTLRMGLVDSLGHLEVREYPVGSFVVVPAGRQHVEGSESETEIHLSGIGPLRTEVVDSGGASCAESPVQAR